MTNNPYTNALAAAAYVVFIVLFIQYVVMAVVPMQTLLIPMAMLSLFVLSAATMGYIFLYWPVRMFFEGDKEGGLQLFLQTVAVFACITVALLAAMLVLSNYGIDAASPASDL